MSEGQDITVTGRKLQLPEPGGFGASGSFSMPQSFAPVDWPTGNEGNPIAEVSTIAGPAEKDKIFSIPGYSFKINIPAADWAKFTPKQQSALTHIFENAHLSPKLTAALRHLHNEGISEIVIRRDSVAHDYNGSSQPFPTYPDGRGVAASISTDWVRSDPTKTDLVSGSKVVINFNSAYPLDNLETFTNTFFHEMLHPYIPDQFINGEWTDHNLPGGQGVEVQATVVRDEMMPRGNTGDPAQDRPSIYNVPLFSLGDAFMGSLYGDTYAGTANNDVIAGMAGNDTLSGGGGNDVIAGGAGMDALNAGAGYSELLGGMDADTYTASVSGTHIMIEDAGGVDRLKLPGYSASYNVTMDGSALILTSSYHDVTAYIHQYDGTSGIELFEFDNGTFTASYIESMAAGEARCYDERGVIIPCDGDYVHPVVLDLKGDGLKIISASRSKVSFDVNADGWLDSIAWFKDNDDVILAIDRNANGRVDGLSEISFVEDFPSAATDLEGLLGFDTNGDGFLTVDDANFASFLLWSDKNSNGASEKGEIVTLSEAGIESIGLEIFERKRVDAGAPESQILGKSVVTFADGRQVAAYDVALEIDIKQDSYCGYSASSATVLQDIFI